MKNGEKGYLYLSSGGMELTWLYAGASFTMTSIIHRPFPLFEAVGTFGLAAVLTFVARGRGWRVISIVGLQVFGFILAALRTIYVFNSCSQPFLSKSWLIEWFRTPKDPLEWFALSLVLFWVIVFWVRGVSLTRRSPAYLTICSRFDLGVAVLFFLLLIKLLALAKGGVNLHDPITERSLLAFFVFSLLAIGLARNQSNAQKGYVTGYGGVGVLLSFTAVVVLFGAGLVLLFLPYLTAAAEMGYGIIKSAAKPLGPIVISVLRFLFMHKRIRPENPSGPTGTAGNEKELLPVGESGWLSGFLEQILIWGLLGLAGLLALILFGLGAWYLFKWLSSKTTVSETRASQWGLISLWVARLRAVLFSCWDKILRRVQGCRGVVQVYASLLHWGRHSGLPHFLNETPREYGLRLKYRFPAVNREISLIIEAFNQEVYGEMALSKQRWAMTRLAWRRLRSPLYWPSRLKSRFFQPGGNDRDIAL